MLNGATIMSFIAQCHAVHVADLKMIEEKIRGEKYETCSQ